MMNEAENLLDSLLQDWHNASKHEGLTPEVTVCPTFSKAPSYRGEQFEHEIAEDSIDATRLAAIQFHVEQLSPEHRTALQFEARNLNARVKVWRSVRLPVDPGELRELVKDARAELMRRLAADGRVL